MRNYCKFDFEEYNGDLIENAIVDYYRKMHFPEFIEILMHKDVEKHFPLIIEFFFLEFLSFFLEFSKIFLILQVV